MDQRDGHHTSAPERVCCLLVLDSVTSTPQWIRQPKPCGCLHDVCVFVCECARTFSGLSASEPPVMPPPALRLSHFACAIKTRSRRHVCSSRLLRFSTPAPHPTRRPIFLTCCSTLPGTVHMLGARVRHTSRGYRRGGTSDDFHAPPSRSPSPVTIPWNLTTGSLHGMCH